MKKITLRMGVAIITFIIGISAASMWFFDGYLTSQDSDVPPLNDTIEVSQVFTGDSSRISIVDEDYAVYSAILSNNRYNSEQIVISDYTTEGLLADATTLNQELYSLTADTINNYQLKNNDNQKLESNFTVKSEIVFLSQKELNQLFRKGQNGWAKFNKRYPSAAGIISFSRVGFNQDQKQALVSVSFGCGWLCGDGKFVILEKENGNWIIQKTIELWVS